MIGRRFGRLVVKQFAGRNKYKHPWRLYRCTCDCGNEVVTIGAHLRRGVVRSCGCLRSLERSTLQTATAKLNLKLAVAACIKSGSAFREVLGEYKGNARKRGLSWDLTDEQFRILTSAKCYYTGRAPAATKIACSGETYVYNGIDRLDSTKGYTIQNCVPCCSAINRMKLDIQFVDFVALCEEVALRHGAVRVESRDDNSVEKSRLN